MAVYPDGKGLKTGLELSINGTDPRVVDVTQGVAIKDFVVINYFADFTITFDEAVVPDDYYVVVLEYRYQKMSPPPIAIVKIIEAADYSPLFHIVLGVLHVAGNQIVGITNQHPTIPEIVRPAAALSDHNSLPNLQGGLAVSEYYHLTQAEYAIVHQLFLDGQLDHNELTGIQGGAPGSGGSPGERYHLTLWEHDHVQQALAGTWKVPFADKLDDHPAADFSLVTHTHIHNSLSDLQGGNGTDEFYHFTVDEHSDLQGVLDGTFAIDDSLRLGGKLPSEYADAIHNHVHNTLDNLQGGNGTDEFYHFTASEHVNILGVLSGSYKASDADLLDGLDSSAFALAVHTHVHNDQVDLQGGISTERYHLTLASYNNLQGLIAGTISVPNADKLDGYDSTDFATATHTHTHNSLSNLQGGNTTERYHVYSNWYNAMQNATTPSSTNPFMTINDLSAIQHNAIGGLQGGTTNQYYHFTQAQHTGLTGGGDASAYHNHNTCYYTKAVADSRYLRVDGFNPMQGNLNMGNNRVQYVATPVSSTDGVNKAYVDGWTPSAICHNELTNIQGGTSTERYHIRLNQYNMLTNSNGTVDDASTMHHHDSCYYTKTTSDGRYLFAAGGSMTGTLNANNNRICGLPSSPLTATEAVSKAWVDSLAGVPTGAVVGKQTNDGLTGFAALNIQDSAGMWLYQKS